jgi:hypothetical protein
MRSLVCAGLLTVIFGAGAAVAGPPPLATFTSTVYTDQPVTVGGAGFTSATLDGGTASISLSPDPSAQVSGTSTTNYDLYEQAIVIWYIQFSGAPGPSVPVLVTYTAAVAEPLTMTTIFGPRYVADPGISLGWGVEGSYTNSLVSCSYGPYSTCTSSGPKTISVSLPTATTDFFQIVAGSIVSAGATSSASIDPTVVIDPTYLALNPGVSFQLSANVQSASAPEAKTWAMMIVGAGLVGATARRRRTLTPA